MQNLIKKESSILNAHDKYFALENCVFSNHVKWYHVLNTEGKEVIIPVQSDYGINYVVLACLKVKLSESGNQHSFEKIVIHARKYDVFQHHEIFRKSLLNSITAILPGATYTADPNIPVVVPVSTLPQDLPNGGVTVLARIDPNLRLSVGDVAQLKAEAETWDMTYGHSWDEFRALLESGELRLLPGSDPIPQEILNIPGAKVPREFISFYTDQLPATREARKTQ